MSETRSCVRGCSIYQQHLVECETHDTCRGCLPQRASNGLLCHTCHRRLELMLTDFPTIDRWLTGNLAGGNGSDYDKPFITGSKGDGPPLPLSADIFDTRRLMRDQLSELVDEMVETHGLNGPTIHTVEVDSKWLLAWMFTLVREEWIGDWWTQLAETTSQAHALAPWRPSPRRIKGVPCPGCAETNLVIYGGETDITCQSCRILITEERFGIWQRVLKQDQEAAS